MLCPSVRPTILPRIGSATSAVRPSRRAVPRCNAEVRAGARFCGACGHSLAAAQPAAAPAPASQPSRSIASYTPKHLAEKVLKARLHEPRRGSGPRGHSSDRGPLLRSDHRGSPPIRGHDQPVHRRRSDGALRRAHRPRGQRASRRSRGARNPARVRHAHRQAHLLARAQAEAGSLDDAIARRAVEAMDVVAARAPDSTLRKTFLEWPRVVTAREDLDRLIRS
jgi:zinc-ribbon domain